MNYKRNIIIIIISVFIYFVITFVYNKLVNDKLLLDVYILKEDVNRGDVISGEVLSKIKVSIDEISFAKYHYIKSENINTVISKDTYKKGQIVTMDMCINKQDYMLLEENLDIISIQVKNPDDIVSYQVAKGSIVDIYYTGKSSQAQKIIDESNFETIMSGTSNDSYVTAKVLENVKIINTYDKNGIVVNGSGNLNESLLDTIMIQTTKENIMKINNLKNYGSFHISIKR